METGEPYAMTSLKFMMQKSSAGSLVSERLWLQLDLQDLALAKVIITTLNCSWDIIYEKEKEKSIPGFNLNVL